MVIQRFDTLIRSLTDAWSRRSALAFLCGSTLGLLGLADSAAKSGQHQTPPSTSPPPTDPGLPPAPLVQVFSNPG